MFKNWMDLRLWKTVLIALWKDTLYFSCFVFLSKCQLLFHLLWSLIELHMKNPFFCRFCYRSKEKHFYKERWKSAGSLQNILNHKCLYLFVIHHPADWMKGLLTFRTEAFHFNFLNFLIFASFWLLKMNNSSNAFRTGKKQV